MPCKTCLLYTSIAVTASPQRTGPSGTNQGREIFAAAILCGVGSALFHPEAALMVNRISGEKKRCV